MRQTGAGPGEGDDTCSAWSVIGISALGAAVFVTCWILAWRRGGWVAWGPGSVLLYWAAGLVPLTATLALRVLGGWGDQWSRPVSGRYGYLPQAVAGLWLGCLGAPVASLVVLPAVAAVQTLIIRQRVPTFPGGERARFSTRVLVITTGEWVGYLLGWVLRAPLGLLAS